MTQKTSTATPSLLFTYLVQQKALLLPSASKEVP